MSGYSVRGLNWFNALSAGAKAVEGLPPSLKVADGELGRFIAVVADPDNRFPRARNGEVGLLEGWGLAKAVDDAISADRVIHSLGQPPAFEQTDFAVASTWKTIVRVSDHGDKTPELAIGHFQRGRQTFHRFRACAQGIEPVQTAHGITTHERSP